jgi:stage IV sporulation protein FB
VNPLNPKPTPFDISWRMLGIHVRVSPWFWLFSAGFGWLSGICVDPMTGNLMWAKLWPWIVCTFLSVLIHELGHVIMGRLCGQKGNIVLHSMGGLAVGEYHLTRRWQQILIALAGPAIGLLLFGVVWILVMDPAVIGLREVKGLRLLNAIDGAQKMPWLWRGVNFLLFMNLMWNVMNLIPVIPMDGGQVVRAALGGTTSPSRMRIALGISFIAACAIAVYSLIARTDPHMWYPGIPGWATLSMPVVRLDPTFNAVIYGILAVQSFLSMLWVKGDEPAPADVEENQAREDDPYAARIRD